MHEEESPSGLHLKARYLLRQTRFIDERSPMYEMADEAIANDSDHSEGELFRRAVNWVLALHRYEGHWRTNADRPRENTRDRASLPAAERRMGEWARYQRRFAERLCQYQMMRLEVSPAFVWDPHEADWQATLEKCTDHARRTGHLPHLAGDDPREFALARWLGRQLRQMQEGALPESRVSRVSALLLLKS